MPLKLWNRQPELLDDLGTKSIPIPIVVKEANLEKWEQLAHKLSNK